MEEKRIDYNAPFLSVRRFHSSISSESKARGRSRALNDADKPSEPVKPPPSDSIASASFAVPPPPISPPTTPLYLNDSELRSWPVRNPGVVPFSWEEAPGCPKESTAAAAAVASGDSQPKILNCSVASVPQPSSHSAAAPVGLRREASSTKSPDKKGNKEEVQEGKPPVKPKGRIQPTGDDCGGDEEDVSPAAAAAAAGDGGEEEEGDDAFSDALDTLSMADSCFMNCSVSGMTGFTESGYLTGGFSTDPHARDFMMGRFLPAAQAVATGSMHNTSSSHNDNDNNNSTSRRAAASPSIERRRMVEINREQQPPGRRPPQLHRHKHQVVVPWYLLLQQHLPAEEEGTEEEEDGYSDAGQLQMKGCGFLPRFCLKGSLSCLTNPVSGVRVRAIGGGPLPPAAQKRSPAVKPPSRHGLVGETEKEHMWEAVYRHKLGARNQMQLEDGSKLMSESNCLTFWSTDSQSPDGSSPYCRSTGGGSLSPYRNDALSQSSFRQGKGFLGSPKEDGSALKADSLDSGSRGSEKYFEIQPHLLGKGGSGSESTNCIRTFTHVNSDIQASPTPRWSFSEAKERLDISNEYLEVAARDERRGGTLAIEASKGDHTMETGVSTVAETDVPPGEYRLGAGIDALAVVELEARDKDDSDTNLQPLLPPPLPKTPSESWLLRTLPSVSSKSQACPTFLGIKFLPEKKSDQMSSSNVWWETTVKDSRRPPAQMRFSEILANPIKEEG